MLLDSPDCTIRRNLPAAAKDSEILLNTLLFRVYDSSLIERSSVQNLIKTILRAPRISMLQA